MPTFKLPTLPYAYDALDRWVDAKTMEIHHTKHHQGYVNKLNQALGQEGVPSYPENLIAFCEQVDGDTPAGIRNNVGGHYNHTLFWGILSPKGGEKPSVDLARSIEATFGSMEALQQAFEAKALGQFGAGWAWLVVNRQGKLVVTSTPNQDNPLMKVVEAPEQGVPILGLDVWEHAYYLRYQNKRDDYVAGFWHVVSWEQVSNHYANTIATCPT